MTDIDAIRARAEAATEGPWEFDDIDIVIESGRDVSTYNVVLRVMSGGTVAGGIADAKFIAHSRTDIPTLLDALESTHALLAFANGQIDALRSKLAEVVEAGDALAEEAEHAMNVYVADIAQEDVKKAIREWEKARDQ
jgi:hypothetical protein